MANGLDRGAIKQIREMNLSHLKGYTLLYYVILSHSQQIYM